MVDTKTTTTTSFFAATVLLLLCCGAAATDSVQQSNALPDGELSAISKRQTLIESCVRDVLGETPAHVPTIGVAGSGGGYRAMVSTWAAYLELEALELWDCVSYVSSVSGSTWAVGALGYQGLASATAAWSKGFNMLDITVAEFKQFCAQLKAARSFGAVSSVVDFWAFLLTKNVVMLGVPNGTMTDMGTPPSRVLSGAIPFPIISMMEVTTSQPATEFHHFMEATPFWYGSAAFPAWTPMTQFCQHGSLCTLSTIMGTASSAFEASPTADALKFLAPVIAKLKAEPLNLFSAAELHLLEWLEGVANHTHLRLDPKQLPNYLYGQRKTTTGGAPFPTGKTLECVDMGIFENIPFPSLLLPSRGVDIILALDQSAAILPGQPDKLHWLQRAVAYAEQQGYPFPPVNLTGLDSRVCTMFRDPQDPAAPIVIYLPLRNATDPSTPVGKAFPSSKFAYSAEDIAELSGLNRANVAACQDEIRAAIAIAAAAKKQ